MICKLCGNLNVEEHKKLCVRCEYALEQRILRKCSGCDRIYIPSVSKRLCRDCWEEVQEMVR